MNEPRRGYVAYLLRMWQADQGQEWSWRASLERVGSDERKGFAGLEGLFAFLREQTGQSPDPVPGWEAEGHDSHVETGLSNSIWSRDRRSR